METKSSLPKIKITRKIEPQEIHLQISLLEDAIKNDRVQSPSYYAGKALAPYAADATIYARQYAERTIELSREFTKLYRLVVWNESSKHFKRRKTYKTLPFSLIEGDIYFQCQTLRNTSDVILGHLAENSDNLEYAKRVLKALIKRWFARHNKHELRMSEAPQTDKNTWPSPVYLFERNPAISFPIGDNPSDPYNPTAKSHKTHPIFTGILASFSALISALLTLAYPLILNKSTALPVLGILAKKLSVLSMPTLLALQVFSAVLALSCTIYLIYEKFKNKNYHSVFSNQAPDHPIPPLRRMSLESLDHVSIHTEPNDDDIEKNSDAESIDLNLDLNEFSPSIHEHKKMLHLQKPGTLIGQQLKSQKIFGLNCDFRSTISLELSQKSSLEPLPSHQDEVEQIEEKEEKNNYSGKFLINPIGETFDVINLALECQDQTDSINAELIHNLAMHAFTSLTWSQEAAQQGLQEILKLTLYPDYMLMLYQDLSSHSIQHKIPIELDINNFKEAINAYDYLNQAVKKGQFSAAPLSTETVSSLIIKNGFFAFNNRRQENEQSAKKLLLLLKKKLIDTCKVHPEWPNTFLVRISNLTWPLCEILIPYLINYQKDIYDNTLLHHLAVHPECSMFRFKEIFNKLYQCRGLEKQEWKSYLKATNQNGDDAAKLAFTVKRIEICQFLLRYRLPIAVSQKSLPLGDDIPVL